MIEIFRAVAGAIVLAAAVSTAVQAQQWNGRDAATAPIWRTGKVALGFEPPRDTGPAALLELNRELTAERALLFSAGTTFRGATGPRLEIDTWRAYIGAARAKESQLPSSIELAVNGSAVVGLAYFTDTVPSTYRLAVGGNIRAEGAVLGPLSITKPVPAGYQLVVGGKILVSDEVRITSVQGWPDHVLADGYRLQSLPEVERFVRTNHHLPGIPSSAEVSNAGVGLAEMQSKLLLKVEELTLHLIEQQKTIVVLQEQLAALERGARAE